MTEDDIYGNKRKYERFKTNLPELATPPEQRRHQARPAKYYCKNPKNLEYFKALFTRWEARDLSYIRRNRVLQSMRLICHLTTKNLASLDRNDIDEIMAAMHKTYNSPKSKETFTQDLKCIFRILFPEKDERGRPDETLTPYVVRHLKVQVDKSKLKLRGDKLDWEEFKSLVDYFSGDPRIQAYLTLALESLRRPQEILYTKIRNVELHDNYAKIYAADHGKEGPGLIQCLDSYPYLLKWLEIHPLKNNPDAWLFINTGNTSRCQQLRPGNINKMIRKACQDLGLQKRVTCYSLKRNGVTQRRLRGESDIEIQHAAGWTSTRQLKTYDLTSQEDAFKKKLRDRGLLPSNDQPTSKVCRFCNKQAGFSETLCPTCKRPLDRQNIKKERAENEAHTNRLKELEAKLENATEELASQKERQQKIDSFLNLLLQGDTLAPIMAERLKNPELASMLQKL